MKNFVFILLFWSINLMAVPRINLISCALYNPSNNPCVGYFTVTNYIQVPNCDLITNISIECSLKGSFTKTAILKVYDPNNQIILQKTFTFYDCRTTLNSEDTILYTCNGQYRVEVTDPESADGVGFDVEVDQTW